MSETKTYTVSIYTENNIGLLNRISAIFQRRKINIESLNTSISEIEGVSRFTIVINLTEERMKKIIGQLEKQVEVIRAFYHTDEETIFLETCLFKIKSDLLFEERQIQNIIKEITDSLLKNAFAECKNVKIFACGARYLHKTP